MVLHDDFVTVRLSGGTNTSARCACIWVFLRRRQRAAAHAVDKDVPDIERVIEPRGTGAEAEALQLERKPSFAARD